MFTVEQKDTFRDIVQEIVNKSDTPCTVYWANEVNSEPPKPYIFLAIVSDESRKPVSYRDSLQERWLNFTTTIGVYFSKTKVNPQRNADKAQQLIDLIQSEVMGYEYMYKFLDVRIAIDNNHEGSSFIRDLTMNEEKGTTYRYEVDIQGNYTRSSTIDGEIGKAVTVSMPDNHINFKVTNEE